MSIPYPRYLAIAVVVVLALTGSTAVFAKTFVLFSPVSGVVTKDGQPVAGAEVEQHYVWHWKDQSASTTVTTDGEGRFSFPQVTGSSFLGGLMPHEPVVEQRIVIRYEGREYLAWKHAKHSYEAGGELGGVPLELECALEAEEQFNLIDERAKLGFRGICRLKGQP